MATGFNASAELKALSSPAGGTEDLSFVLGTELADMAQSHHFTIKLSKININYKSPKFGYFLPVRNIGYSESTYDNMSISAGVFGDLTFLHKKRLMRFSLTLYDDTNDSIEKAIKKWECECFTQGIYVNYLSNIVSKMEYRTFGVNGKLNQQQNLYVIPADTASINRSYEENGLKTISLNLIVVGTVGNSYDVSSYSSKTPAQVDDGDYMCIDPKSVECPNPDAYCPNPDAYCLNPNAFCTPSDKPKS